MNLTKHWAAQLDDYVIDLAWSPEGSALAGASSAGPISLFSAGDGAKKHDLPGHTLGTNALAWRVALASGGQDGAVKFWDAASGQHTAAISLGTAWVEHLAWCPNSSPATRHSSLPLAAAAGRKLAFLAPDGSLLHAFPDTPKTITALAWCPAPNPSPATRHSSLLLAIAFFGGVRLIDGNDFSVGKEFAYANGIHALAWSPDGKWLVSGNQDPSVHLWVPAQDIELQMSGYESKVRYLSFDCTSRWLATAGGRDACIWDCSGAGPEGREPAMFPHDSPVCAVAFQNSHGLLATASQGGEVRLWSPERRQPLRATARLPDRVTKLAWSPDDRRLAIGSEKGMIYVLNCET